MFLIFWDEYHIGEFVSSLRAREQLTRFVLEAFGPTDLVAFMDPLTTLDSIRFTRDRRSLAEQVHKLRGRRGVYIPARSALEEEHLRNMRDVEMIRAQVTAGAIKGALLHLGSLREGRKTLIVVSESLGPLRDQTTTVLSDLMRTANDTNTAIVTVDPRGLQVGRYQRASDTLLSLSAASGGDAIVANDLDGPLRKVVRQTSAFYLLGYDGSNSPVDGKFHQIKVRVKRDGLEVRFASRLLGAAGVGHGARPRRPQPQPQVPPVVARALAELPTETARRPADFWVGVGPGREGGGDVTIAWMARATVGGRVAATVDVEANRDSKPVHAGPVDASGVTFNAPPGPLVLTLSVRDAEGELIDRDVRTIAIPQPTARDAGIQHAGRVSRQESDRAARAQRRHVAAGVRGPRLSEKRSAASAGHAVRISEGRRHGYGPSPRRARGCALGASCSGVRDERGLPRRSHALVDFTRRIRHCLPGRERNRARRSHGAHPRAITSLNVSRPCAGRPISFTLHGWARILRAHVP